VPLPEILKLLPVRAAARRVQRVCTAWLAKPVGAPRASIPASPFRANGWPIFGANAPSLMGRTKATSGCCVDGFAACLSTFFSVAPDT
jgi:hypothetical protein